MFSGERRYRMLIQFNGRREDWAIYSNELSGETRQKVDIVARLREFERRHNRDTNENLA